MFRTTLLSMTAVAALSAPALAGSHSEEMDIVATAQEAGKFSTLLQAAEAAGLVERLQGEGPLTVFAPTDEAFAALPKDTLNGLLADPETLADILTYHVVEGAVMSSDLSDGQMVATVNGAEAEVSVGDSVMIGDATVVTPDIEASNGVIHAIDTVMMPPM